MAPETRAISPAPALQAEAHETPVDGGTLIRYDCRPRAALDTFEFLVVGGIRAQICDGGCFAAGHWYSQSGSAGFGEVETLPFPYNTYRRMRWRPTAYQEAIYRPALDLKLPLLGIWCEAAQQWLGLLFDPILRIDDRCYPLMFSIRDTPGWRTLSIGIEPQLQVDIDKFPWFGFGRDHHRPHISAGPEESFALHVAELTAPTWDELTQLAIHCPLLGKVPESAETEDEHVSHALDNAWRFLSRAHDTEHGALVHLLRRGAPGQVSAEFKHSHVTPELHALQLSAELAHGGSTEAAGWAEHLTDIALHRERRVIEGEVTWWHTTTRIGPRGLEGFTHHGAGFVGFPGGQATNARHLADAYQATGDERLADLALATARWLLQHQRTDGAWPTTVPVTDALSLKPVDEDRPCIAASAECIRALLAVYAVDPSRVWLDAADRGLEYVNSETAFFESRGYLRDVAPNEPDGMTAEAAIHANLDRACFGPPDHYVVWAKKWATYALHWLRPLAIDSMGAWTMDAVGHTITPRIDVWSCLLLGTAWARLHFVTEDDLWRKLARRQLDACLALQEADGGLCETWWYEWDADPLPVPFESTFLALALLDLGRALHPNWQPPEPPAVPDFYRGPHDGIELPGGLACSFHLYEPSRAWGLIGKLLRSEAKRGGPASVASRALGFLRMFRGGDDVRDVPIRLDPKVCSVFVGPEEDDEAERVSFMLEAGFMSGNGRVPMLVVEGATDIARDGDALLVTTREGSARRIHIESNGNVVARDDGTLDLGFAAHWASGGGDWTGVVVCTHADGKADTQ